MERCKTCKHWKADGLPEYWGVCELIKGYAFNNILAHMEYEGKNNGGINLHTHSEFGCVQHREE